MVTEAGFITYPFQNPIPLLNIDGSNNTAGQITHYTYLDMGIPGKRGHISRTIFAITNLDDQDVVIRIDWLQKYNPQVNWKQGTITLNCCTNSYQPINIKQAPKPEYT